MDTFTLVVFLHVLGATALVGHSLSSPLVHRAIRRASTTEALLPWLLFARDAARLNPPASIVVLLTGLWLAQGRWAEGWLQVSAALFVASAVLAKAVVARTGQRLAGLALAAPRGPVPPEVDALRRSTPWNRGADALLANGLALLFLMVNQPGFAASAAVALGTHAAVAGARAAFEHRPAGEAASRA